VIASRRPLFSLCFLDSVVVVNHRLAGTERSRIVIKTDLAARPGRDEKEEVMKRGRIERSKPRFRIALRYTPRPTLLIFWW
jgi:hypothetical protein